MDDDEYEKERMIWVAKRFKILDQMDEKLHEMKKIAEYARDHTLQEEEKDKLNQQLQQLGQEVEILDRTDKNFWLEWQ